MPTRKLSVLVVSGLVLGGGFVTSSYAGAGQSRHDDRFTLAADITDVEKDDRGKDGPSEGDRFTFEYDLFEKGGDQVGDGSTTCELVRVDRGNHEFEADCDGVLDLDDGELKLEGTVTDDDHADRKIVLDVIDGTSDFDDAEGKATFRPARGRHGHGGSRDRHHAHDRDANHHDLTIEVDLK